VQTVTITTETPDAEIRYTTDGSEPDASSTLYTGPISISTRTTLQAKAFKAGLDDSEAAFGTYF
jgi:chitinase